MQVLASRQLLLSIFVKQYQGESTVECLISKQDMIYLRESNFEDFPERFNQNEWKIAFFHNKIIQAIRRKQMNMRTLEHFMSRRKAYSL